MTRSVFCMYCNKEIKKGELDYPTKYNLTHDKTFYHMLCYDEVVMTLWKDPEYRHMFLEKQK